MLDIDIQMTNIQGFADKGELFDGRYKLLHTLSTDGATADVWLALDTNTIDTAYDEDGTAINGNADETGMLVAIKIYKPKSALDIEGEQRFRDEYKIVYDCRHENLLQPIMTRSTPSWSEMLKRVIRLSVMGSSVAPSLRSLMKNGMTEPRLPITLP